nr:hypothetical protein [Myxococcales bacterium]
MWIIGWAAVGVASPWVEGPGEVRLGLSGTSLVSERQFAGGEALGLLGPRCPEPVVPGQRMPYSCVTGGTYTQRGVLLSGTVGLGRGVAVDVGVPVVVASFDDDVGRTGAGGVGDVRAGL